MNRGLTGLELHQGEYIMNILILGWTNPLILNSVFIVVWFLGGYLYWNLKNDHNVVYRITLHLTI